MKLNPSTLTRLNGVFGVYVLLFASLAMAQEVRETSERNEDNIRANAPKKADIVSETPLKDRRDVREKERVKVRATVDVIDPSSSVNDIFSQLRKRDAKALKENRARGENRVDRADKAIERIDLKERASKAGGAGQPRAQKRSSKSGKAGKDGQAGPGKQNKSGRLEKSQLREKAQKGQKWGGFDKSGAFDRGSKSGKSGKGAYDRGTKRDDRQQHPRSRGKKLMGDFPKRMMPGEGAKTKAGK